MPIETLEKPKLEEKKNLAILEEESKEVISPQSQKDQEISNKVWLNFDKWRTNRNRSFSYFRERNLYQYINDCNARFNNYKEKPAWKDEWQANISDITIHAKIMAIIASAIATRMKVEYASRISRDIFSKIKAGILQDIYRYTDEQERNGTIDDLFLALKAAREGTVIGFEGFKKTKLYEKICAEIVPLEDFYPSDLKKFDIRDQLKCVWRTVIQYDDFKESYDGWYQVEKVKPSMRISSEERGLFNISNDILEDQVEILRHFDKLNDEFYVTANSILIIKPDGKQNKLSNRRNKRGDGFELGFWKTVYEPYDENFFYGRSLVDLMRDNQDAIDFIFNTMFDKETLALLRPLLVGGVNQLADDYLYPGRVISVSDVQQIKELPISAPDLVSFNILKELQVRQSFISISEVQQGIATGNKTATEVSRAEEAARKILSLFNVMLSDALRQKGFLRGGTIIQYYLNREEFEPIILESTKLLTGKNGTRIIKVKSEISPANQLGFSQELEQENAMIQGESEIIEITPEFFNDFKFSVGVRTPSTVEMSGALQKAFDREFFQAAIKMPDLFDRTQVARKFAESMNQDWEEISIKQPQALPGQEGMPPEMPQPGGEMGEIKEMGGSAIPSLKSQLTETI